ncbi:trypco2 family protein [Thiohalorhabdus sp.]|uniref:trypco2 family protein n=1 Tax=Thiohalorhabdus sp. TaxID=3094134 RepID=UPI002FC32C05
MELQEFVANSLSEIARGVQDAIQQINEDGREPAVYINPRPEQYSPFNEPERVSFDIAVTASEKASGGGKAGISVVGLELGGGGEKGIENTSVSRIQFSIPVSMPGTRFPNR